MNKILLVLAASVRSTCMRNFSPSSATFFVAFILAELYMSMKACRLLVCLLVAWIGFRETLNPRSFSHAWLVTESPLLQKLFFKTPL